MSVLETKRIVLRPVENRDLSILSCWRNTDDYLKLVSSREKDRYFFRFLIELKKDKKPIGIVYTFSYNKHDGYMFLNVFLEKENRKSGYGAEACILTILYAFDSFSLYKMYCDACFSNYQSISMMRNVGLEQEGLLKGHRFYEGERYDMVRFAVHQQNLPRLRKILQKLQNR